MASEYQAIISKARFFVKCAPSADEIRKICDDNVGKLLAWRPSAEGARGLCLTDRAGLLITAIFGDRSQIESFRADLKAKKYCLYNEEVVERDYILNAR